MLTEKMIGDYYRNIGVMEICKSAGMSRKVFQRLLKEQNLEPRRHFLKRIDTGDQILNETLKTKYLSIVNRCTGKSTDKYGHYKSTEYMPVYDWVDLCNENKELLLSLWRGYVENDKDLKYAVSIDRLNNEKGYVKLNIQFVMHGFNSWKRNIYPVSVTKSGETKLFMSSEEGSRFYGIRRQTINECLRKTKYHLVDYVTLESTIKDVLEHSGKKDIKEYYEDLIQK